MSSQLRWGKMKNFQEWQKDKNLEGTDLKSVSKDDFIKIASEYFLAALKGNMKTYSEYNQANLIESVETSRYSVEINYRTTLEEALEGYAKLVLGYVSASLKNHGYHTKHIFTEKPLRLLVTTRNWDQGSWTGLVTWNSEHKCFVLSKGFYNKERKTISVQNSKKCEKDNAADIAKELNNMMHHLKDQPDKSLEKLKPVSLKPGPKG